MSKQPVRIVISYVDTEDREIEWSNFHTLDVIPDAIRELTGRTLTKAVKITVDGDQPFPFLTGDLA